MNLGNLKYDDLQTGDLILLYGGGWTSYFIKWFTKGTYSHIAMILRDPVYIDVKLEGLYVIEANYPANNLSLLTGFLFSQESNPSDGHPLSAEVESKTISNGVDIVPFENVFKRNQHVYYRKLNCTRDASFRKKIKMIHDRVHHEPYDLDIKDWLAAEINIIINGLVDAKSEKDKTSANEFSFNTPFIVKDRTDAFWCSALIGYFYVKLGLLDEKIKWTLLTPENFSNGKDELKFINCTLDTDKLIS